MLIIHVLGACVWTGGHLVLATSVLPNALKTSDIEALSAFEARFERIGIPSLIAQVVTGIWLAHHYLPNPLSWWNFDQPVHAQISLKLLCLGFTVALALHARLRLIPNLNQTNLRFLALHIWMVTLLSIVFVIAGLSIRAPLAL